MNRLIVVATVWWASLTIWWNSARSRQRHIIPVEVKSRPLGHTVRRLAIWIGRLLLVEDRYKRRPPHGLLHYADATLEIPFDDGLRRQVLDAAALSVPHVGPRTCTVTTTTPPVVPAAATVRHAARRGSAQAGRDSSFTNQVFSKTWFVCFMDSQPVGSAPNRERCAGAPNPAGQSTSAASSRRNDDLLADPQLPGNLAVAGETVGPGKRMWATAA
ncbi:MAG: hypothetical protein R3A10_00895 [Caldilineaceae bacterium]